MNTATLCTRCGSVIPAKLRQCPRCLLGMALTPEEKPPSYDAARRQFGNYVLGRQIGAGGMGVVYEARRVDDERRLAVKVIRDFYVTSATTLTRFTIEAEAAARLDHPNIVRIHEIGDSNGQPFFSMDLIDGESLHAKLANGGFPGDERAMSRFMAAVARAVHHAHVRGVVHRDLKPANILIDAKGEPHLTDFGLAKILQSGDEVDARSLTASSRTRPSSSISSILTSIWEGLAEKRGRILP